MSRKTGKPVSQPAADRRVLSIVGVIAVAVALGVGAGLLVASPGSSEPPAVAALRAEEAKRDVTQITELTKMTRNTKAVLQPVLTGLSSGTTATADQVTAWKAVMAQETQRYAVTVSGMTGTNVARGAFRNAVEMLSSAVDTYALALSAPAGAQQQAALELAARQRKLAVSTWSVAATQLDQLNNDAGNGHQHVYLTDSAEGGAMTPDGTPEGK